jgi:pyrroloquinoline-quinone synthase
MDTRTLDPIVARHDLNTHPFYRAWREGTLPRSALAAYASEYAPFIDAIELGWRTLGEDAHADAERDHAGLWHDFRAVFGPAQGSTCSEAQALASEVRRAFADPVDAVGALYAFEAQQPATTRSKLDGLRAHYAFTDEQTAYFRVHADDYGEREHLANRVDRMSPADRARAERACEQTCRAMWTALDGILGCTPPAV